MVSNPFPTSVCSKMREWSRSAKLVVEFYRAGAQRSQHSTAKPSCLLISLKKKSLENYTLPVLVLKGFHVHTTHTSPFFYKHDLITIYLLVMYNMQSHKYKMQSLSSVSFQQQQCLLSFHFLFY